MSDCSVKMLQNVFSTWLLRYLCIEMIIDTKSTVIEIANLIEGIIEGDENVEISTLSKIEEASEGALTFLSNIEYSYLLGDCKASAIIIYEGLIYERPESITFIRVKDPQTAFGKIVDFYTYLDKFVPHVSEKATISPSAKIGSNVYIADHVFIGANVEIGDNCEIHSFVNIEDSCKIGKGSVIHPFVSLYHHINIGDNCILHSGCVIGADGFGFVPQPDGTYYKISHIGGVTIGDNVEIGSNSCIDRSTMGSTIVRNGVKLDKLVQIAHNTDIGENSLFAGMSAVAGSSKIGHNVVLGDNAAISDNCAIADHTTIDSRAKVFSNIKEPHKVWKGSPAIELNDFNKSYAHFKDLNELAKRVEELERVVKKSQ